MLKTKVTTVLAGAALIGILVGGSQQVDATSLSSVTNAKEEVHVNTSDGSIKADATTYAEASTNADAAILTTVLQLFGKAVQLNTNVQAEGKVSAEADHDQEAEANTSEGNKASAQANVKANAEAKTEANVKSAVKVATDVTEDVVAEVGSSLLNTKQEVNSSIKLTSKTNADHKNSEDGQDFQRVNASAEGEQKVETSSNGAAFTEVILKVKAAFEAKVEQAMNLFSKVKLSFTGSTSADVNNK